MSHIPDQLDIGGIKDVMQGNSQFDNTETCSQVPAGNCDCIDRLGAQFIGNLLQVPRIDTAQICRALDRVEEFGGGFCQEVIVGRHALITFPTNSEALVRCWQNLSEHFLSPNTSFGGSATTSRSQRQSITSGKVPRGKH